MDKREKKKWDKWEIYVNCFLWSLGISYEDWFDKE
jgi:hypothetical protein